MSLNLSTCSDHEKLVISLVIVVASAFCFYYFRVNNQKLGKGIDLKSGNEKKNRKEKNSGKGTETEKPFESSYYYAHNSSRKTGGYTDGLKIDDYIMNVPRLLSKNGVPSKNAPKVASPVNGKEISDVSLPIKKFSWEDSDDNVKIRIEKLPVKGSVVETRSWEQVEISRESGSVTAELINDGVGMVVKIRMMDQSEFHLRINNLFGKALEIKAIRKVKRLIVKITKKNHKAWPTLESTTPAYVDENEFMADVSS